MNYETIEEFDYFFDYIKAQYSVRVCNQQVISLLTVEIELNLDGLAVGQGIGFNREFFPEKLVYEGGAFIWRFVIVIRYFELQETFVLFEDVEKLNPNDHF